VLEASTWQTIAMLAAIYILGILVCVFEHLWCNATARLRKLEKEVERKQSARLLHLKEDADNATSGNPREDSCQTADKKEPARVITVESREDSDNSHAGGNTAKNGDD